MVRIEEKHFKESSILQYKKKERSRVAKKLLVLEERFRRLIRCMMKDTIAIPENVDRLNNGLF
jgi:hypothetical protein